jgi:hypothetical protein
VRREGLEQYYESAAQSFSTIPSPFVWNAAETRIGAPKKQQIPFVIVSVTTPPETRVTVPEIGENAQLTPTTAMSAFGDRVQPLFISEHKTFDRKILTE